MVRSNQVVIGPEFFVKAKSDYADWRWAMAREFMQNCLDAPGISTITVDTKMKDGDTELTVANDGAPMTEDILRNKLLSLGASGKNFANSVGGFGKAKEVLYFTHKSYEITSGNLHVEGEGAGYDLREVKRGFDGTKSVVMIANEVDIASMFIRFISMCQRPMVTFIVNGNEINANLRKGTRRRDLGWAVVYTNKSYVNRMIVRIDGMPMFTKFIDSNDKCVVVELEGTSGKVLQSNRDGLVYQSSQELDEFIRQITVDKHSAFRETSTTYTRFAGDRLASTNAGKRAMADILNAAYANKPSFSIQEEEGTTITVDGEVRLKSSSERRMLESTDAAALELVDCSEANVKQPSISHEFIVKNNLGMVIPAWYTPYDFGDYSRKMVQYWAAALLEIHRIFSDTRDFSVGFILDEEREAEFERGVYGDVFYINPAVIRRNSFGGRSLAKRWKMTPDGKMMLVMVALHEYVHRCGFHVHDENYSNRLTEMAAVILKNIKGFHKFLR